MEFESDFLILFSFLEKVEGKTNLCLTGITTHKFCVSVCAIRFLTNTEKETELLQEAQGYIKTIISKISQKILNRLQIA